MGGMWILEADGTGFKSWLCFLRNCVPLNVSVSHFFICKMRPINIPTLISDHQDLCRSCLGFRKHNSEVSVPCWPVTGGERDGREGLPLRSEAGMRPSTLTGCPGKQSLNRHHPGCHWCIHPSDEERGALHKQPNT